VGGIMKTTNDITLKSLCYKNTIDRQLYILQVLLYWCEREIVSSNYNYSEAHIDKQVLDNADDIIEYLVRNYKREYLLSHYKVTKEIFYMFKIHNYSVEDYLKEYADKKGRLQLIDNPKFKEKWYELDIWKIIKNWFRK
jgi:hypothetical protein